MHFWIIYIKIAQLFKLILMLDAEVLIIWMQQQLIKPNDQDINEEHVSLFIFSSVNILFMLFNFFA